jgi:hypothetical protein
MQMDRSSSTDPADVAALLDGCPVPWAIAGGWAIDLFLGRRTRPHADVDVALFRADQDALRRHLAGWTFQKAVGGALVEWAEGERLDLPVHEIHARSPAGEPLEFLLNERVGDDWVYRRDARVRCPADRVIMRSAEGIPHLCPAVALLYKAKAPRPADEQDFEAVREALPAAQRRWLRDALSTAHPDHPWLRRI